MKRVILLLAIAVLPALAQEPSKPKPGDLWISTTTTIRIPTCPRGYVLVADAAMRPKCARELIEPEWTK